MMSTLHSSGRTQPFDFDEWMALAHHNPDEFEQRRREVIDAFIRDLPPARQQRLRGLQFRIDMERRRARTPMGACVKLSAMMWDALLGPHGLRSSLTRLQSPAGGDTQKKSLAQVVSFRKN